MTDDDEEIYGKRDYNLPGPDVICVGDFVESIDHTTPENRRNRAKAEHIMKQAREIRDRIDEAKAATQFAIVADGDWKESTHPRGQPGNAGEFAKSSGGGGSKPKPALTTHFTKKAKVEDIPGTPKFASWDAPSTVEGWAKVPGQMKNLKEPPIPDLGGKKFGSGLLIHEPDGRIWLTKPKNAYAGYKYSFPKGGVEKGLSPQANAIKEAYEETGLQARIVGYAGDSNRDTSVARYYHAERVGGTPTDHGWESEGVTLAHPDDLLNLLNRSTDQKLANLHLLNKKGSGEAK